LDLVELQHKLNTGFQEMDVKLAVVVPGSRLAYLARLAFGYLNYRVFYESVTDALQWLQHTPLEVELPKKLLIADVPEALPVLTKALESHFHVLSRTSWTGACLAVHEQIDLVLCGIGFEESKMFDLLDYLRSQEETRDTPFLCVKSVRQKLPSTINDGIGIALQAKGTAGYIDFEGWQSRFGEQQAAISLREKSRKPCRFSSRPILVKRSLHVH
jgi:CheY-like chemotaxis protein